MGTRGKDTRRWADWHYPGAATRVFRTLGRRPVGGDSERGVHVTDTRTGSAGVGTTGDGGPLRARAGSSRREVRVTAVRSGADDWMVPVRSAAQRSDVLTGVGPAYFAVFSHAVSGALCRASIAAQVSMRSIA